MTKFVEDGEAAPVDPASFRYLSQVERRKSIVRSLAGEAELRRVIDLGCGDGRIGLQFLSAHSVVTLVDIAPTVLERASRTVPDRYRDRVRVVHGSIADVDDADQYDLVLAIGVLAHVDDLPGTLAKIASLVSPSGRAILQLTDASTLPGAATTLLLMLSTTSPRHYRLQRLTERRIVSALASHGMNLTDRARYSALYRRHPRPQRNPATSRLGDMARRAVDPWGAEKFLVFRPSLVLGQSPTLDEIQ